MHDQVAQLADMGIPAAMLNSTQPADEQRAVMRAATQGAFRLLYLSPERLAREDTVSWLEKVPLALFAIDEAHCISEWGHEFRPEYRQLASLRQNFPDIPIAAFTASATRRVRHDILEQLRLRDPHKYIASFHRGNLRYVVEECAKDSHRQRLLQAARAYAGQSIIVYAPTIALVEELVDFLGNHDIPAVPYNGQMEAPDRRRNQERWMNDDVRVLVGTIAFGLGINKAAVRAVIHTSLPKSIEQYYQEAGRAGRDGEAADCVLLWQPKDTGLLAYFIDQLQDPQEKERAWQRYHAVRRFVESARCRHLQICNHFGQTPKWTRCDMCDVCGNRPAWLEEPVVEAFAKKSAKKKKKRAAQAEAPRTETRREPAPTRTGGPIASVEPPADRALLDFLKQWRLRAAQRAAVPAYVVLSDASLEDLCRKRPSNLRELLGVFGFGERKAEMYGSEIFAALEAFRNGARAERQERQASPAEETMALLAEGKSLEEIARIRGRRLSTVVEVVVGLIAEGCVEYRMDWLGEARHNKIAEAVRRLGTDRLKTLKDALPPDVTYEELRLVVAWVKRETVEPQ